METGNLIADFENAHEEIDEKGFYVYPYDRINEDGTLQGRFCPSQMCFNKSWEWLMPVVDIIEDMEWKDNPDGKQKYVLECSGKTARFILEYGCRIFPAFEGRNKIEAIYMAVTDFITRYNKSNEAQQCNQ